MLSVASKRIVVATKTLRSQNAIFVTTRGVTDNMKLKEKVEEDLYIRAQEKKFFEAKKAAAAAEMATHELEHYQTTIAPAMVTVQELLKKSGDRASDAGLESIARWKLGLE